MSPRTHATPVAAKQAIEQRLRSSSASSPLSRSRQLLVYDRFLARVSQVSGDAAVLKGGLALELRLKQARTTRDVDLRVMGSPGDVLASLQRAGRLDLGVYMAFEVQPHARHPDIQNMKYDGLRFQARCMLAGKIYGNTFGVDVAFGDPILGEPDEIVADDVLGFMGVEPTKLRIYPVETHIAEKLHAYTLPRPRPNSRVKDLPDLALLATTGALESLRVRQAIEKTFTFRDTHTVPPASPALPRTGGSSTKRWPGKTRFPGRRSTTLPGRPRVFWTLCLPEGSRRYGIGSPGRGSEGAHRAGAGGGRAGRIARGRGAGPGLARCDRRAG